MRDRKAITAGTKSPRLTFWPPFHKLLPRHAAAILPPGDKVRHLQVRRPCGISANTGELLEKLPEVWLGCDSFLRYYTGD